MVVSTGSFTKPAIEYSEMVSMQTNLNIVLIEGKDLKKIVADPSAIIDIFNEKAQAAMEIKKTIKC